MFEKFFEYFSINNPVGPNIGLMIIGTLTQWFFLLTTITFLSLLIQSLVLFTREKNLDPSNRKYLPRVLGFSSAFVATGLALSLVYLS